MSYEDLPAGDVERNARKDRLKQFSSMSTSDIEKFRATARRAVEKYRLKFKKYDVWRQEFSDYTDADFIKLLVQMNHKAKEILANEIEVFKHIANNNDFIEFYQNLILEGQQKSLKELAVLWNINIHQGGAGRGFYRTRRRHSGNTHRTRRSRRRNRSRRTRGSSRRTRGGSRRTRRRSRGSRRTRRRSTRSRTRSRRQTSRVHRARSRRRR